MSRLTAPQRRRRRYLPPILLLGAAAAVLAVLLLVVLSLRPAPQSPPQPDPHEGQVYINDGSGMVWHTPQDGVPVSETEEEDFRREGERVLYIGNRYYTRWGVDVSAFQGDIDWDALHSQGIQFAYLRIGYRGYTEGVLQRDRTFAQNYEGAKAAGIDVGVYFFSQALTVREAAEEALYALELLEGRALDLPVYFDWEPTAASDSRTASYDYRYLTECAAAFCNVIEQGGYEGGVYLNRQQGYYRYDLSALTDYSLWVADYGDYPDFYYAYDVWQYSDGGVLEGVDEVIDLNVEFRPVE